MKRPVVVLVAGEPIDLVRAERGSCADMIRRAGGDAWAGDWRSVDLRDGSALPEPGDAAAFVISGSASSVTDREPWVLRGEEFLRHVVAAEVPVFGICFGHQMLGQALGGNVERNPRGREIGTVDIEVLRDDPLLAHARRPFRANMTHVDSVTKLPPGAAVLCRSAREPHAAVRFTETAWGVQFHPEMDARVMRSYVDVRRELIDREGLNSAELFDAIDDAPAGGSTLRSFLLMLRRTPS